MFMHKADEMTQLQESTKSLNSCKMVESLVCGLSTLPTTTYGLSYSCIHDFIRQKPEAGIQLVNRITWVASDVSSLILQA